MKLLIWASLKFFVTLTILTGIVYPSFVTGIASTFFRHQAGGSAIYNATGEIVGSEWIGQYFKEAKYFWTRPSATSPYPYNPAASSGSNLAASNPALLERILALLPEYANKDQLVPLDLLTTSASGLEPFISREAAQLQAPRVAESRALPLDVVEQMIKLETTPALPLQLGNQVVNVIKLNAALDRQAK